MGIHHSTSQSGITPNDRPSFEINSLVLQVLQINIRAVSCSNSDFSLPHSEHLRFIFDPPENDIVRFFG